MFRERSFKQSYVSSGSKCSAGKNECALAAVSPQPMSVANKALSIKYLKFKEKSKIITLGMGTLMSRRLFRAIMESISVFPILHCACGNLPKI